MGANRHHDAAIEDDIAMRLTDARKNKGIRQIDVAHRLGVTKGCICQWETGITYPQSFNRWQQWASAVGENLTIRLEAK